MPVNFRRCADDTLAIREVSLAETEKIPDFVTNITALTGSDK